ncbi:MAG: hypothetical protein DCC49_01630 [Acidobacteria bacterium]|nr:MAG: hypothetical protein DCC49_01630 [Acidobacteriota bacterium]
MAELHRDTDSSTDGDGDGDDGYPEDGEELRPDYDRRICSTCYELYSKSRGNDAVWRCSCRGGSYEGRRQWYIERYGSAPDIMETWSLCCLCAQDLTFGVSRWSWLVCQPCREAVTKFHESVGAFLIPIGAHSLMNGVGLQSGANIDNEAIRRFTKAIRSLSIRWTLMLDWRRIALVRNLEAAGAHPGLNLTVRQLRWRLRRAAKTDARLDQANALDQFLEWIGYKSSS